VARVLAVANDLLLGSRVEAMLGAAGHEVTLVPALPEAALDGFDLVVADLDSAGPDELAGLGVPVLGYYSHVEVETREAALAAGIEVVVPRSRMSRELPSLVSELLSD
jgi:hypothetical protein